MDREQLRREYMPSPVRVLFVGESSPAGGTFFYAANSRLFSATHEAFVRVFGEAACGRGEAFLAFFMERGCYLDDLCLTPVNKLASAARERERQAGVAPLACRIAAAHPRVVVVVGLGIQSHVAEAAQQAARLLGQPPIPVHALPFPSAYLWARFVQELEALIRQLLEAGILEQPCVSPQGARMSHDVLSVTFEIDAQSSEAGRFSIPADVCGVLRDLKDGDSVRLVIQTPAGTLLFAGEKALASGREVYGADIRECVKAGQRIRVVVSRP